MSHEPCPACKGKCCRDYDGYKLPHMGDEFYAHVCEYCDDGTKYAPPRTSEEGLAEGELRERAAVVAYLLAGTADCRACMDEAVVRLAREIERGEHRSKEEK